ncbi:hypothetical protein AYM40_21030 [Paraburkholderia phytofirmans OLGA172]|uniref:DNA-binding protein H-NS-like C-terminal domain-containing protein n=1 Tax=Paraburkholderia phytofirmans OLGA172 TaxID=1417228 RepID=A0A161HZ73_9BURK|nr:H-NS family nucleoid-associated regulatory protein [Paraburkholderia phytofirmans]ANB74937.1 hypothetical protein AYM40_21030 [Paraburkholderia phytofirmans OLGA172]
MATLEQIQNRLKKLQAQADALIAKKAQSVVDQIRELMLKHGLTIADIETNVKARREAKTSVDRKAAVKTKGAKAADVPKYLDRKTGATWTGRGRAPAWIASARDRTKFLADVRVEAVSATDEKSTVVANGVVRTGQPKGTQPAMYVDRKTGATWSGRGRAPSWLAAAKDRTKFLIDPVVDVKGIVSKEEVAPTAIQKGAVGAKKVARKKLATAKKAVIKEVSTTKMEATSRVKRVAAKKASDRKSAGARAPAVDAGSDVVAESPAEQLAA